MIFNKRKEFYNLTFFEKELEKIFGKDAEIRKIRFVGNACYGKLSEDMRFKAEFRTSQSSTDYDMLAVTVIGKAAGPIDTMCLQLADIWEYGNPRIWKHGNDVSWAGCSPAVGQGPEESEYKQLSDMVDSYLYVWR